MLYKINYNVSVCTIADSTQFPALSTPRYPLLLTEMLWTAAAVGLWLAGWRKLRGEEEVECVGGGSVSARWQSHSSTHITRQNTMLPSHCLVVTRGIDGNGTHEVVGGKAEVREFTAQGKWIMKGAGHSAPVRDFTVIELPCSSL